MTTLKSWTRSDWMKAGNVLLTVVVVGAWAGLLPGCVPKTLLNVSPAPVSPWGEKYALSYNPPEKPAPNLRHITVAVVNPSYKGEDIQESALAEAQYAKVGRGFSASMGIDLEKTMIAKGLTVTGPFASLQEITYNEKKGAALTLAPKVFVQTKLKYKGDWQLVANGPQGNTVTQQRLEQFSIKMGQAMAAAGVGSQKVKDVAKKWAVIITSGMPSSAAAEWAEIFAQGASQGAAEATPGAKLSGGKKGTVATAFGMMSTDAAAGLARYERSFTMTTSGWVYFIMQEPMSGEKMWVKKLELDPVEVEGTEARTPVFRMVSRPDGCGGTMVLPEGFEPSDNVIFDGTADAMATTLQKVYPSIMKKFELYLDANELEALKEKGKEIRALKVY